MEFPHQLRLIPLPATTSEGKKLLTEEKGKEHMWHKNRNAAYRRRGAGNPNTGNNKFHFLPAVVLGLNCRESMWVTFPCVESPGGPLCQCPAGLYSWQGAQTGCAGWAGLWDLYELMVGGLRPLWMSCFRGGFLWLVTFLLWRLPWCRYVPLQMQSAGDGK